MVAKAHFPGSLIIFSWMRPKQSWKQRLADVWKNFFPGFLIIGSNGGGEYIALDARAPDRLPVVALDMTNADLRDTVLPIAKDFDAFVELIGIEAAD
jgi:hypothetical protein